MEGVAKKTLTIWKKIVLMNPNAETVTRTIQEREIIEMKYTRKRNHRDEVYKKYNIPRNKGKLWNPVEKTCPNVVQKVSQINNNQLNKIKSSN